MAEHPKVLADRIMGQLNGGQFKSAFKTAKGAAKAYPSEAFFPNLAGMALAQSGDEREAVQWFRKAFRLSPHSPNIQDNLLQALINTGQGKIARDLIEKILPKRADSSALLFFDGLSRMREGDLQAAEAQLDHAIAADPQNASALNLRGVVRFELGREPLALADYRAALAITPNAADTLSNMSQVLGRLHRADEGLEAVQKAVAQNPQHAIALERLAVMLNESGRKEDAKSTYRRLLNLIPAHADALLAMALLHDEEERPALFAEIGAAKKSYRKGSTEAGLLDFATAHLLLKLGDLAGSDAAFAAGNLAFAKPGKVAVDQAEALSKQVFEQYSASSPEAEPSNPRPVFVLGLPRSGTTLVEQMLSADSKVFGAGELPYVGRIIRMETAPDASEMASLYRASLPQMPPQTVAFIDKMPANFMFIGPILSAFPNAKVLHIRRDPRDVALSMWRTWFSAPAMAFTCDQAQTARYLNLYARCMAHWNSLFSDRIIQFDYEDIVANPLEQSKRLATAAGLDWSAEMATPEQNTAQVLTASVNQVREGVHVRSVGGWRAHRQALQTVIDGLDPALWPDLD